MQRLALILPLLVLSVAVRAQDASTGALRGVVTDATGARVAGAEVRLIHAQTGEERSLIASKEGLFVFQLLPPGEYGLQVTSPGMATLRRTGLRVEVGGEIDLAFPLEVAGVRETVTVSGEAPSVETQPAGVSTVLDERAILELPLNGRRFTDLALLTPGVTQDPRSLTSGSNGDLAFGGIRGFQTSFLVDGVDDNNAFFSQERGRYRAPYQFSNEVIQEFRVSSSTYGPELGRSGSAVINVVTRSGGNQWHGSLFDYYRDGRLGANYPDLTTSKPPNRQDQFGFTLGGPIKHNRAFFFAGFDQHIFHIPTVVQFANGATAVVPQPTDYEASDQALVFATAAQLSQLGGQFRTALVGDAAFGKLDFVLSPHHHLSARLSTSRYYGQNNVFFDPASPVTNFGINNNGEEDVSTESAVVSLNSALSPHLTSHLRLQFSRDLQNSIANSSDALVKIYGLIDGFGRSDILPRTTREHRLHLAETLNRETRRHQWKFGGDILKTWIYDYFPAQFGPDYRPPCLHSTRPSPILKRSLSDACRHRRCHRCDVDHHPPLRTAHGHHQCFTGPAHIGDWECPRLVVIIPVLNNYEAPQGVLGALRRFRQRDSWPKYMLTSQKFWAIAVTPVTLFSLNPKRLNKATSRRRLRQARRSTCSESSSAVRSKT